MTREHFEQDQKGFRDAATSKEDDDFPRKGGAIERGEDQGGIGWAVKQLLSGAMVTRRGWNGKGMHLFYVPSDGDWHGYVAMYTVQGTKIPWLCSQTDLLAIDWEIATGTD